MERQMLEYMNFLVEFRKLLASDYVQKCVSTSL